MKVRNIKFVFMFLAVFALTFILPQNVSAANLEPQNMNEFKSMVESAKDGDVIDLVKLYNKNEFKPGGNDFSSLGLINVNSNITIMSSDPKKAAYGQAPTEGGRAVYISNISLNIASKKTLTMKGYLYLKGPEDRALISGEGNLYLTERMNLSGQNGKPAIYLPNSSVKIENLMSYTGEEETGEINEYGYPVTVKLKYYSRIIGGDSSTERGADAIVAKDIEVNQTNLEFIDKPNRRVDRGLFIRGGNGLSDSAQGGHGLKGENIIVDLSGEKNEYHSTSTVISGGAGGYGQGAIIGKNINIKCAGYNKIASGNGVDLSVNEGKRENFYYGTIEVEGGGHLDFATKEFSGLNDSDKEKMNSITGGDRRYIDSNGNPASENFVNGKSWTNFYGPIILARGNASVNVYRGKFTDKGSGDMMSPGSPNLDFMYKLPHSPVIEMGSGTLNFGIKGQTDPLSIGCGSHYFNTSEAIIDSKADVNVYGAKTIIEGPTPGGSRPYTGYSDNPIAPKVGASGIRTPGKVLVDGANICGGGIYNILSDNGSKKDLYRFGSGIKAASEVKLVNGAVVQGYGPIKYLRDKSIYPYGRFAEANVSAGYGLENVGSVYIENSEVHGGDISTTRTDCTGTIPGSCEGKGNAGAGIKNAKNIQIIGDSLITGGSSINQRGNLFADRLSGGSAIDGAENLSIKGGAQIYGGGSSTKSGHAIANVNNLVVEGDEVSGTEPTIFGGGCRPTSLGNDKQAGSGLYMVGNATIKAGKIEAGNKLYQTYIEAYKTKMHPSTKSGGCSGLSPEAYAISASGKVIIDGQGQFTPKVMSYTPFDSVVKGDPISSIFLKDGGALYVGKAKVFSGGDEEYRDKNILLKGGKYHVDIFKENTINSYEKAKDKDGKPQGIKYRTENSTPLYRILKVDKNKNYSDLIDEDLKKGPAYDGVFEGDFGILLYKSKASLGKTAKEKAWVRKDIAQGLSTLEFKEEKDLSKMADDNIVLKEIEKPEPKPQPQPEKPKEDREIGGRFTIISEDHNNHDDGHYENHIKYIYGYPDKNIKPEGNITRAEAVAIAVRLKGISANNKVKPDFEDVEKGQWYIASLNEGIRLGLLDWNQNKIRPNDPITRGEMAKLFAAIDEKNNAKSDFPDIIGHKYEKEINMAFGNGRIVGYSDGTFKPDNNITRAEAVIMFNSIFNRIPDRAYIDLNEALLEKYKDLNKKHWAYYELMEAANSHKFKRKSNLKDEIWLKIIEDKSLLK